MVTMNYANDTLTMSYVPEELADQIHTWSTNKNAVEIWSATWSDPTFIQYVSLFCGVLGFLWFIGVVLLQHPREFIVEQATAFLHALLNTVISSLFLMNHTDIEFIQMNVERQTTPSLTLPPLVQWMRLFLAFQAAYCIMDSLQLLLGIVFQRERVKYRLTLIVHHSLVLSCCSGIFLIDPYIHEFYARNSMIELTTVFLHIRNFAKKTENATMYFVGGLGTLFIYLLFRVFIPIYCSYIAYHGLYHLFVDWSGVVTILVFNAFVFAMSLYYSVFVLWATPSSMYILKRKKDE